MNCFYFILFLLTGEHGSFEGLAEQISSEFVKVEKSTITNNKQNPSKALGLG